MLQIRRNVFETNSSSTHSLTMCSKDEYDAWINGEVYFDWYNNFVSKEERDKRYKIAVVDYCSTHSWKDKTTTFKNVVYQEDEFVPEDHIDELTEENYQDFNDEGRWVLSDYDVPVSFNEYFDDIDYETFDDTYTTKSGDEIVAFGYYGWS